MLQMHEERNEKYEMLGYNQALFDNMAYFVDAVWEINVKTSMIFIMQDKLIPEMDGKVMSLEELKSFMTVVNHKDELPFLLEQLKVENLKLLKKSIQSEGRAFIQGEYHLLRCIITPLIENNVVHKVYFTFQDCQELVAERELRISEVEKVSYTLESQVSETLGGANIGMWKLVVGEGHLKMGLDKTAERLAGVPEGMSGEEIYEFLCKHVDRESFFRLEEFQENLLKGIQDEIVYSYSHPERGLIYIRCGGRIDSNYEGPGVLLRGYHQDVSDQVNSLMESQEALREQMESNQRRNTLYRSISSSLAMANDISEGIQNVLQYIGETFQVSRVYIFEDEGTGFACNTYEWCNKGILSVKAECQHITYEETDFRSRFLHTNTFYCADARKVEDEGLRKSLERQEIKAMLQYAIFDKGKFCGFVGIDDCLDAHEDWKEDSAELETLSFVSHLLSMYLIKERNFLKLEKATDEREKDLTEQLDAVLGGIKGGMKICYTTAGLPFYFISDQVAEIQGYTAEEFLKINQGNALNNVYWDDRKKILEKLAYQTEKGDTYYLKYRVKHRDGSLRWVYDSGKRVISPDGVEFFYSLVQDVTERENASEMIFSERAMFRNALTKNAWCNFVADITDGLILEKIITSDGTDLLQKIGKNVPASYDEVICMITNKYQLQFINHADKISSRDEIKKMYDEGITSENMDIYIPSTERYIRLMPLLSRNPNNRHLMCYCVCTDITTAKQAEIKQLKDAEEKLRLQQELLEEERLSHRQEGILQALSREYKTAYYVDLEEDTIVSFRVTDELRERFGAEIGKERIFSKAFTRYVKESVVPEEIDEMLLYADVEELKRLLQENDFHTHVYRINRNGVEKYVQLRFAKIENEVQTRHLVFGIAEVDRQIREEQEYQRALEDALEQANMANKAKTTFLSNMSHDIRTPMNAIIGYAELAQNYSDNKEKLLDYLKKIQVSSEHLLSLINDVLDMSRIEAGKTKIVETENSLSEVMEEIRNMMLPHANPKYQQIHFVLDNIKNDIVWCDKLRLTQILINCMSNSIKYTPENGAIMLSIRQIPCETEGYGAYEFKVVDNGIGMSADFVKRIFEPFEREQTSTASGIQGTGLGMSITKSLVDMMGGTISVESEIDQGSEFLIVLKFKLSQENSDSLKIKQQRMEEAYRDSRNLNQEASSKQIQIPDLKDKRILVVEDNMINQEIILQILKKTNAFIDVVVNGKEAVERVMASKEGEIDLILMDIQMPVMDGYEATRRIRGLANEYQSSIPIVAMTANAFDEDKRKCKALGMVAHVAKPIRTKTLFELLGTIM